MGEYWLSDADVRALAKHVPGANRAREPFGWDSNTKALVATVESMIAAIAAECDEARAALARVEALPEADDFDVEVALGGGNYVRALIRAALAGGDDRGHCDHCGAPLPHAGTSWREAGACVRAEGGDDRG